MIDTNRSVLPNQQNTYSNALKSSLIIRLGKILSINGTTATVAYSGNRVPANLGVVKAQVGDWVLVHAGLVIQVLSESQAQEINNLLAELETLL